MDIPLTSRGGFSVTGLFSFSALLLSGTVAGVFGGVVGFLRLPGAEPSRPFVFVAFLRSDFGGSMSSGTHFCLFPTVKIIAKYNVNMTDTVHC